jgi:hypothetical protein
MAIKILKYDTSKYLFQKILLDVFKIDYLEKLQLSDDHPVFNLKNDQSSYIHQLFYNLPDSHLFFQNYKRFIMNEIWKLFTYKPIVFQKKPTFRIQFMNNVAVGEFHKDSDYNHPKTEINYYLPITNAFGNNTIWIESEPNKKDYKPIELKYGEIAVFDGANLMHGNQINDTGYTRISIDFRAMTEEQYTNIDITKATNSRKIKLKIGEYYDQLHN